MAGEVQQGKAQIRFGQQALNGRGRAADAVAARHQAHLAFTFEKGRAQLLGHAAGPGHQHAGIAARDLAYPPQRAHDLLFRFFAHRAGIDHHHPGLFQRRFRETARREGAREPQGVVHVHLAAEGDDMETFFSHGRTFARGCF